MADWQQGKELISDAQEVQEDKRIFNLSDTPDPELNPVSSEFNINKYNEHIERLKKNLISFVDNLTQKTEGTPTEKVFADFIVTLDGLQRLVESRATYSTEQLQSMKHHMERIVNDLKEDAETLNKIRPYLLAEIKRPEYKGITLEELRINTELWNKAIYAALANMERQTELLAQPLPFVNMKRADSVEYPVDKINSNIWYNLFKEDTGGQLCFAVQKKGTKDKIPIVFSIDFDALGDGMNITKRLTQFDKRVYIAISALFNAGNNVISLTQIHYAMGNEKRPSREQIEKINSSITKMTGARITLDNSQEIKANYNYDKFIYDGSLLPLERGAAVVNGQIADAAIHIFREPPAMTFAKQRKQITTLDIKLLQSPLSKTEGNLLIDDYLIERISRAKKGNSQQEKILYKTLYEKAEIKSPKQKQRAADKIKGYLEHYRKCGFINRYALESDGIKVYF